jgi:hypothetical protein
VLQWQVDPEQVVQRVLVFDPVEAPSHDAAISLLLAQASGV